MLLFALGAMVVVVTALAVHGYAEARRDPLVRTATIGLADWPTDAVPVRVALLSDIHLGSAAMDAPRLARIVGQINRQHPDLVLIAGDFIDGHAPGSAARLGPAMVAPLSRLRAPLGIVAVLGNHDHWTGETMVTRLLRDAHVTVLANQAVARGPLIIGGIDDSTTDHDDSAATLLAMLSLSGAQLFLSHSPDITRRLPSGSLLLAGHTHCGQIVLPLIGTLDDVARAHWGDHCGLVQFRDRSVIVTGGLGTSDVPLRIGAPPDWWLVTLGPAA